jgi:hypothetical protein
VPDFTVIEGGKGRGPEDFDDDRAQYHVGRLIVEILRGLARGADVQGRIERELAAFVEHANASNTPINQTIATVLADMHNDLIPQDDRRSWRSGVEAIALASLRFAAETCSQDDAAKGRASRRGSELDTLIELHLIGREERSRENGWSYFRKLLDQHFPAKAKPRGQRKPRGQPRRREREARQGTGQGTDQGTDSLEPRA